MTRDWITSPSPRDVFGPDPEGERAWWTDEAESSFPDYPAPSDPTGAEMSIEPLICRCQCGCENVATNGLFCANCDPSGRFA